MSDQDTETPIECLFRRLKYHSQIVENCKQGSEVYKLHKEKEKQYSLAIGLLRGELTIDKIIENEG